MDKRQLASYAYHNCEFRLAIDHVLALPPTPELAEVHIKSLCELDAKETAVETGSIYLQTFPSSGQLHYFVGVAHYLAGHSKQHIEAAFLSAADCGFAGGSMGFAFLEASAQRYGNAVKLLLAAVPSDAELEHARHLSLFQVLTLDGQFAAAEDALRDADLVLSRAPSLLRHYWGQLCWIRCLRAQGRFDGALALVERLLAQLDAKNAPRLHRNATEARKMIEAKSVTPNLNLPKVEPRAGATDGRQQALERITRKPMLHSLYVYLNQRGRLGASKEDIVQSVWEESYNPVIHDDRIYKAIGRLRKLLGDDQQAPRYLTQMGRNYVLTFPTGESEVRGDQR